MSDVRKSLVFTDDFLHFYGAFFGAWASIELILCYGIHRFLKIPAEETHILTAGMDFGRKCILLRNLVRRSDDGENSPILHALKRLQNDSKRNVFAHAFIVANADAVTFIDRSRGGDYSVSEHTYTMKQWSDHVLEVLRIAAELERSLGIKGNELHDFARAALRADTKSVRSPTPPNSIKKK